jgi:hypothetical protein
MANKFVYTTPVPVLDDAGTPIRPTPHGGRDSFNTAPQPDNANTRQAPLGFRDSRLEN